MGRMFGKFGESSAIFQTKTIQISSYNKIPFGWLFICQTFFCQTLEKGKFAKHSPCQIFLIYSIMKCNDMVKGAEGFSYINQKTASNQWIPRKNDDITAWTAASTPPIWPAHNWREPATSYGLSWMIKSASLVTI